MTARRPSHQTPKRRRIRPPGEASDTDRIFGMVARHVAGGPRRDGEAITARGRDSLENSRKRHHAPLDETIKPTGRYPRPTIRATEIKSSSGTLSVRRAHGVEGFRSMPSNPASPQRSKDESGPLPGAPTAFLWVTRGEHPRSKGPFFLVDYGHDGTRSMATHPDARAKRSADAVVLRPGSVRCITLCLTLPHPRMARE